jgi:hypothetical protein
MSCLRRCLTICTFYSALSFWLHDGVAPPVNCGTVSRNAHRGAAQPPKKATLPARGLKKEIPDGRVDSADAFQVGFLGTLLIE